MLYEGNKTLIDEFRDIHNENTMHLARRMNGEEKRDAFIFGTLVSLDYFGYFSGFENVAKYIAIDKSYNEIIHDSDDEIVTTLNMVKNWYNSLDESK